MAAIHVARVPDCPICLGIFKDPRFLPCGHTFCLDCIKRHGESKVFHPDCPNCRKTFQIPPRGFEALPKNYSLSSVLSESRVKVTKGLCKKHTGEDLVLYCVECSLVICLDCRDEDHQKHDCYKISRFAKEARTQLERYANTIKPILSQVTCKKSEVEDESKKFYDVINKCKLEINEECDSVIQLVNDHRRLLHNKLITEKERVTKDLKMKSEKIEKERLRLTSFNAQIEELLQGTDEATTFDLLFQYKDLKDRYEILHQTQPQAIGQVNVTRFEFLPGHFKDFIGRRGNAIGRLQKKSDSATSTINSLDQNNLIAMEQVGIRVISNIDGTFSLKSDCLNVDKTIDELLELRRKKPSVENNAADYCDAPKPEVETDWEVWYYLKRKYQDKSDPIAKPRFCVMEVVYDYSKSGLFRYSCEAAPNIQDESGMYASDAIERFTRLYERVSESKIVKENVVDASENQCERLSACLAKLKVSDLIVGSQQMQPYEYFCLAQIFADDGVESMKFMTPSGLTVYVRNDEIGLSLDAIVSVVNEFKSNGDALAFARAEEFSLQSESYDYIKGIACVMHTSAGNLLPRIKYVIHTVGLRKSDARDEEELLRLVTAAIFNCLCYANDVLEIQSVAFPPITSGFFGVPLEIFCRASFEALKRFDCCYACYKKECLKKIYFLNDDFGTRFTITEFFQTLNTAESTISPRQAWELIDQKAEMYGRQRIETTTDDNCFTRALTTALQKDFQFELDWREVDEAIREELNTNKDHYEMIYSNKTAGVKLSAVVKNTLEAFDALADGVRFMEGDEGGIHPDAWISAAANALQVKIVFVCVSKETLKLVETLVKPRLSVSDKMVFIAYYFCRRHHFDALVQKFRIEGIVSGNGMAAGRPTKGASA